jgi:hypothetical protein
MHSGILLVVINLELRYDALGSRDQLVVRKHNILSEPLVESRSMLLVYFRVMRIKDSTL